MELLFEYIWFLLLIHSTLILQGLYDIHIHLKRMPLLEWDPPQEADLLTAKEVMSKNLTVLREHESVEYIEKVTLLWVT